MGDAVLAEPARGPLESQQLADHTWVVEEFHPLAVDEGEERPVEVTLRVVGLHVLDAMSAKAIGWPIARILVAANPGEPVLLENVSAFFCRFVRRKGRSPFNEPTEDGPSVLVASDRHHHAVLPGTPRGVDEGAVPRARVNGQVRPVLDSDPLDSLWADEGLEVVTE